MKTKVDSVAEGAQGQQSVLVTQTLVPLPYDYDWLWSPVGLLKGLKAAMNLRSSRGWRFDQVR